ncbi:hypothetical protein [Salinisphaera sp.]|uniref:hypothetical protein n=1 Tax=Salinisphaera sp. TaxID=1914330 RepID=UPI002D7881E9|nr:hypothetical protein [Salinisphaera sp.]HET7313418.1 hypothetical protein [Salinisphaera sp.]
MAGLITAAVDTFSVGNGIAFTFGTYLVLGATVVLLVLGLLLAVARLGRWLRGLLFVLAFILLVGTGFAAYFLTATLLIAFMAIGLIGWAAHLLVDPAPRPAKLH